MKIELKILDKSYYSDKSKYPKYATKNSAGVDLVCTKDTILKAGERKLIPTGLAMHIGSARSGVVGLIVPRSSTGTNGLVLANTVGVIDEDYQGEIQISAWNSLEVEYIFGIQDPVANQIIVRKGDRIAQMLFMPVSRVHWEVVEEFSNKTKRGKGGFGSTGG